MDQHGTCANCGGWKPAPNTNVGMAPSGLCHCCRHDFRPVPPQRPIQQSPLAKYSQYPVLGTLKPGGITENMIAAGLEELEASGILPESDWACGSMERHAVARIFEAMARASGSRERVPPEHTSP